MPNADEILGQRRHVPLSSFSAAKVEALLGGRIPHIVPVEIQISPDGVEQFYSIDGLEDYRSALSERDALQVLSMLESLCKDTVEYPELMSDEVGVLAEDRLFWDRELSCWRYLMLLADSAAWQALPEFTPDEIWSALFTAAMETDPDTAAVLQSVVSEMSDKEFSVEELLQAIQKVIAQCERVEPSSVPLVEEDPEEEEEYRPWEMERVYTPPDTELAITEPTDGEVTAGDDEKKPAAEEKELPVQPVIPGIKPPPPPVRERASGDGVSPGASTTVLLKPETSVLDGEVPVGGKTIGKIETAKIRVPRVVRMETQEMAYVDRAYFVIGSKPGAVDFLIRNNRTISRRHAAIVTRGTDFYILDLGSRNGVFMGNKRIPQNQETLVYVGDVFTLANEKFKLQW